MIQELDRQLLIHFDRQIEVQPMFSRSIVSFQDNKKRAAYRWFKYKEAFASSLIKMLLAPHCSSDRGLILDPFAGSGTALFTANSMGFDAHGIELLPIGQEIIKTRDIVQRSLSDSDIQRIEEWKSTQPWIESDERQPFQVLPITDGAYSPETHDLIERYLGALDRESSRVQSVLKFALLCILESVSYTRKDGQYLRWDYRSGRRQGENTFDKGLIHTFNVAINDKLEEILYDIRQLRGTAGQVELFDSHQTEILGDLSLMSGSCLDIMPELNDSIYNAIVTSPPYCNRYDYTRTYALELAILGVDKAEIVQLRQAMLSSTVENRAKDLIGLNEDWSVAIKAADEQTLLQSILQFLEAENDAGRLNNLGIPRMVRGYFYEMACVIYESYRVLKQGGQLYMVNDNVRYAGIGISVDLILSNIAEKIGFSVQHIYVLPQGKGNSSQQMGEHGRTPLRKCIYVWRKD
jgi:DNA modification methylase